MRAVMAAWFAAATCIVSAQAAEPLSVCLENNAAPLSWKHGASQGGFDLLVAEAVAKRLGKPLTVQWFGLAAQPESDKPPDEPLEDALLSDGRCRLIGGYALLDNMLGTPAPDHSRLPAYDGASSDDRRREVALRKMAATRGYHFLGLTVLLAPATKPRPIHGLDDVAGLRIGVEAGTLGDAVMQSFRRGALAKDIREFAPGMPLQRGGGVLDRLERGDIAAAFIETNAFDAYRADHPATKIAATGYVHPVGFNLGFAGLASDTALLRQVDGAIAELLASGELPTLAAEVGLTFLPPRQPEIRRISLGDLLHAQ
jgi:ABC-type amino acid transport substrate-binding protein